MTTRINVLDYGHPAEHPASIIVTDADNQFVTDVQITQWNLATRQANTYIDLGALDAATTVDLLADPETYYIGSFPVDGTTFEITLSNPPVGPFSATFEFYALMDSTITFTDAPAPISFVNGDVLRVIVSTNLTGVGYNTLSAVLQNNAI